MLYGVTQFGGGSVNGSVFRLNTDGTGYEKIHAFTGLAGEGGNPVGALVSGPDAALYGTTSLGGDRNFGTVFRVTAGIAESAPVLTTAAQASASGELVLSWPARSGNYLLESSDSLLPNSWTPASEAARTVGNEIQVSVQAGASSRFFRLRKR